MAKNRAGWAKQSSKQADRQTNKGANKQHILVT